MLDEERKFYDQNLASWLTHYPDKFALVKGWELIGTFDTTEQALAEGAMRFGLEPFLIRRIQRHQENISIPALDLGLLRADTQRSA